MDSARDKQKEDSVKKYPANNGYQEPIYNQPTYDSAFNNTNREPVYQQQPNYDNRFTATPSQITRGLEYLATVDQLFIKQEVEVLEIITGFETANKYSVTDQFGNLVFSISEESGCCNRFCCGPCRSFNIMIRDTQGQTVMQLVSPNYCTAWCCLRSIEVQFPPGTVIGFAKEQFTWCGFHPKVKIQNSAGETFLTAHGPLCAIAPNITGDADFVLTNNIGDEVFTYSDADEAFENVCILGW